MLYSSLCREILQSSGSFFHVDASVSPKQPWLMTIIPHLTHMQHRADQLVIYSHKIALQHYYSSAYDVVRDNYDLYATVGIWLLPQ